MKPIVPPLRPYRAARRALARAVLLLAMVLLPAPAGAVPPAAAHAPTRIWLPLVQAVGGCGATGASFAAIPVLPPRTDRPAGTHADLNLAVRGYVAAQAPPVLVAYDGAADPLAPQLSAILAGARTPRLTSTHRVHDWNWACGPDGCRSDPLSAPPVTLLGLAAQPGQLLYAPARAAEIYGGGYMALVLYAGEDRITLKYTREDNVVHGYTVHLERVCVDPHLLALYRSADAGGRHALPALRAGQPFGTASDAAILVAVRDSGAFLDPRSAKDWWR